jgi:hypothetical protein
MILFPYKKVVIETELSEEEFLKKFKAITLEEDFWSDMFEMKNILNKKFVFVGKVARKKIKFRMLYKFEQLYALFNFREFDNIMQIELIFEVSFYKKILSFVWFISLFVMATSAVTQEGLSFLPVYILPFIPFIVFFVQFNTGKIKVMTNKILEISEGKIIKL